MALENDDLPKAPDKAVDKQPSSSASGVTKAVDDKLPKPMKEKTNLEELDEIELETLLKETITYKSPRDRDCRSSLFNKLLVSAEDSIRKDSALNASGSEAVRHRNPQASRRSRYNNPRTANSSLYSGGHHTTHAGGKLHLHGGGGGVSGREGKGGGDGGSIADKGTLGGSLNNLTVEDLYDSISQHLQQRPEKSVSARQRTGGSLPCNVNAGLITPCETPLFATERKSSNTNILHSSNCPPTPSTATSTIPSSTTSTIIITTTATSPITTTSTYCLTTSSSSSSNSSIIYGLSSNNTSLDSVSGGAVTSSAADAAVSQQQQQSNISSHYTISSSAGSNVSSTSSSATGSYSSAIAGGAGKECCVIEVEQEEQEFDCLGGGDNLLTADMIGIQSNQTKSPASNATNPSQTTLYNNNNNPISQSNPNNATTNCSNSTSTILSTSTNPLLDGNAFNIPHIDDDDIIEEQNQRQYQHKLNDSLTYNLKNSNTDVQLVSAQDDVDEGTELQPMGNQRRSTFDTSLNTSSSSSSAGASSLSDVEFYYLGNKREDGRSLQQGDRDDVERRPLLLKDIDLEKDIRSRSGYGRGIGSGPMKIVGQGPTIKHNTTDSLHRQLVTSSIQTGARVSLEDPPICLSSSSTPSSSGSVQHLPSLSHHHSTQQPHHQHTGAVRISSLSSPSMLNLNHRRLQPQQDGGEDGDSGEVVIGVPSSLTGMTGVGVDKESTNFLSERTIHVGDVVETPAVYRQSDQDNPPPGAYNTNYGVPKKDDNGNPVAKTRKKTKPEAFVRADQVEGHRGDIATGDINTVMAFICGNDDNSSSNVAKTKTVKSSAAKLQHRASVSGTNSRAGGKSVDVEHHSHSRRHQNHHTQSNQHIQPPNQQNSKKLHRANSLEEMPTTTLEEFHENESKDKQETSKSVSNKQTIKVLPNNASDLSVNKKVIVPVTSDNSNSVNSNNVPVQASLENSAPNSSVAPSTATNNRGRGVLRATKSNAEKSEGSRSGGSVNRGSVTRTGVGVSGGGGEGVNLMQPRRSWTNADPSPLQAIQHSTATTASAENLETDFTLVNSKKKKGKKQQQRRNSVGSRTPLNTTQQQTITSPPNSNNNQQRNNYNNRHNHNMSNTSEYHANNNNNNNSGSSIIDQQRSLVVNLASLVQSNVAAAVAGIAANSHIDKSSGDCSSSDGDSEHSGHSTQSNPPNLTSYASITKNNVATQQPIIIHNPPQPQTAQQTIPTNPAAIQTPKWPNTQPTVQPTNTTTTITATINSAPNTAINNNNTTTATVVHPENVVVAVQVKVVTNRSQEQQTDDIPPMLLLETSGDNVATLPAVAHSASGQQQIGHLHTGSEQAQHQRVQQNVAITNNESDNIQQHCDPPSLGDMQRWPSISNNTKPPQHTNHATIDPQQSDQQQIYQDVHNTKSNSIVTNNQQSSVTTWPSLGNPNKHPNKPQTNSNSNIPIVSAADLPSKEEVKIVTTNDQTRVVVRSNVNKNQQQQLDGGNNKVTYVKQLPHQPQQQNDVKYGRDERIIVKDDRATVDLHNKVNSVRHGDGGGGGAKQNTGQQQGVVVMQNHLVQQHHNIVHQVLLPRHPHGPQTVIPLTKLPPPNLIDHNTPPPPNFISQQIQHVQQLNHIPTTTNQPQYQQYNQSQQIVTNLPPNNCVVYTPIQLPVNIPDVQMIEHQLQLQHNNNNNNNNSVHTKNNYNQQQTSNDNKSYNKQRSQVVVQSSQPTTTQQPQVVDFIQPSQVQTSRRPAVVIMRGTSSDLNQNSPLGDVNSAADDSSCSELTFGFDVNEELLSLPADDDAATTEVLAADSETTGADSQMATMENNVGDGATVSFMQNTKQFAAKDVGLMFGSRFMMPEFCTVEKEFNYEKIVDFISNAWYEAIAETDTGKCNYYQDL